jgi:hypothetical protein
MANRSQNNKVYVKNSLGMTQPPQSDGPVYVAYCLSCDRIIAFDKSLDFVRYQTDKHLRFPQTIEDQVLIGKIYDLQGELTESRVKTLSRQI